MEIESIPRNRRILIVDDSSAIHDDFKKNPGPMRPRRERL